MIKEISDAVLQGNVYDIEEMLQQQLETGIPAMECLDAMMAGLEDSGKFFERGDYFLPELMISADTFKTGMEILVPHLSGGARQYKGTVVLGTVQGDVHDIGKNLVGFLLESAGFRVIDLGVDVPVGRFIEAVKTHCADVLALSALLTTTMLGMENVIAELRNAGLRSSVKVMIGGSPLSRKFAEDIQADGYGATAPEAVEIVKNWFEAHPN